MGNHSSRPTSLVLSIAPPRVDKQLGWVVRDPRFRPNLNIQPIKKINGGPHLSARHQKSRFNLIWAFSEWLEHEILEISDFGKMSGSHVSKTSKKRVLKNPVLPGSHFSISLTAEMVTGADAEFIHAGPCMYVTVCQWLWYVSDVFIIYTMPAYIQIRICVTAGAHFFFSFGLYRHFAI